MIGVVYRYTNKLNGMKYIGSHKGTDLHLYRTGSKYLKEAFRKFGKKNFIEQILYTGPDFRELEDFILEVEDVKNNPNYYNRNRVSHPDHQTKALQKANSKPRSEKIKKQISNSLSEYTIKEVTTGYMGTASEVAEYFGDKKQRDNIRMYANRATPVQRGKLKGLHFITI